MRAKLATVTIAGTACGLAYCATWAARWGATDAERTAPMPGDEIVGGARYRTTRAVTVEAPPEQVWPWLVQIGQGRGGMYSYDWAENLVGLHMHSADAILPELQQLAVGDRVGLVPEGTAPDLGFRVLRLEPPHLLLLGPEGNREDVLASGMPYPCWTFAVQPTPEMRSRLVVRFQSDFRPDVAGVLVNKYALAPLHFVMERKMLLGIKRRVERASQPG